MRIGLIVGLFVVAVVTGDARAEDWQAGTARTVITPKRSTWMAGYGARKAPSEGTIHDLWAKALALKDAQGKTVLLITLDVCGIDNELSAEIRDAIGTRHKLDRSRIALACSHTHSGPVIGQNLLTMYRIDQAQGEQIQAYTREFARAVIDLADKAMGHFEPVELSWGRGLAGFAVNRRENPEPKQAELRSQISLKGPVDHDVPVLLIKGADAKPRAIICGYACHCTVLDLNKFNGDYAGFAQIDIEKAFPGTQAMFVAGCGADQNPQPRRLVQQAEQHGRALAEAVSRTLAGPLRPVPPTLATSYEEVPLTFAKIPTAAELEKLTRDPNFYESNRAKKLLRILNEKGKIEPKYPYPVQVWNLGGGEIDWVFLGGEVVVDYVLRLKRNLDPAHVWATAYTNDVMAYIPSLRVLKEGGYEGGGAMLYYGQPSPWTDSVEEDIFGALGRTLKGAGVLK